MLDYLKKFNGLPAGLRQKVSNPRALATIENLEGKYQVPLAPLVMRVMVKEIALKDLASHLLKENLAEAAANELAGELKEKIFFTLADYLSGRGASGREAPRRVSAAPVPAAPRPPGKLAAKKPASQPLVKGASFFFSADDEAEIRKLAQKINLAERTVWSAAVIAEKIKAIVDRLQINFGSADLADRFEKILKTYLRGIRSKLETRLTLTKPFESGGLSFDRASAGAVMEAIDQVLNLRSDDVIKPKSKAGAEERPKSQPLASVRPPAPAGAGGPAHTDGPAALGRDAPYDFSKLAGQKKASAPPAAASGWTDSGVKAVLASDKVGSGFVKPALPESSGLTAARAQRPAPAGGAAGNDAKELSDRPETRLARQPERGLKPAAQSQSASMPFIRRRFEAENLNLNPKVKVEDVKYVPKVMSPLDELKYLDLTNFRRLEKDPLKIAPKIKSKIDLLAEEGYGKRLEGVKCWRSSPVNKLYLEIGRQSISENKAIDVIIEKRKTANRDYLTREEFKAIMDLNKSLRF